GVLIASVGFAAPFLLNAVTFIIIVAALLLWKPVEQAAPTLPPEPLARSMVTGVRYAFNNAAFTSTLLRSLSFFLFASAFWALLPLVAVGLEGGGSEIYGMIVGAIGLGAVFGAILLPKLKSLSGADALVAHGTLCTAAAMIALSFTTSPSVALPAAFFAGVGWILVLTNLNVSAQTALPNWVRARGLSIAMMVFFGCMSVGSLIWGQIASVFSVQDAYLYAAGGLIIGIPLSWRSKLGQGEKLDLAPAMSWPEPIVAHEIDDVGARGPVCVTIEYMIDQTDTESFLTLMMQMRKSRFRDGAVEWGIFEDTENPDLWLESFLVPTWDEHLRQHQRTTVEDEKIHASVWGLHKGTQGPKVRHFIAPRRRL
ncbi:MAG: MFS transporter, partial [Pseudomonadota bacterium]